MGGHWCIRVPCVLRHLIPPFLRLKFIQTRIFPTCRPTWSKTCSIGDKSVDRAGKSKVIIRRRHSFVTFAVVAEHYLIEKCLMEALRWVTTHAAEELPERTIGLTGWLPSAVCDGTLHITSGVGTVCHCKSKARLRRSSRTSTHVHGCITTQIESWFVAEDNVIPIGCGTIPSNVTQLQTKATVGGSHWSQT